MEPWRNRQALAPAEKAFLAQHRLTSDTLEVCCRPGETSYSVVDKSRAGYSWAHFGVDGEYREMGFEDSRPRARAAALELQRLWSHRCVAAGLIPCQGVCFTVPPAVD
jgi:hypothetical protein